MSAIFNPSKYAKNTLKAMLNDPVMAHHHATIKAYLEPVPATVPAVPAPVPAPAPAAPVMQYVQQPVAVADPAQTPAQPQVRPTDTGKTYHDVNRDLTAIFYSKGYAKISSRRPQNLVTLYKSDAERLIAVLQAGIASGAITDRS